MGHCDFWGMSSKEWSFWKREHRQRFIELVPWRTSLCCSVAELFFFERASHSRRSGFGSKTESHMRCASATCGWHALTVVACTSGNTALASRWSPCRPRAMAEPLPIPHPKGAVEITGTLTLKKGRSHFLVALRVKRCPKKKKRVDPRGVQTFLFEGRWQKKWKGHFN